MAKNVTRQIELDGLDAEDKAKVIAQLGQVRKRVKMIAGNTSALNSFSQCGNGHLVPALLRKEAEEMLANATALISALDELPIAS